MFYIALQFVLEELNVQSLETCSNTLEYACLRAEPDFRWFNLLYWNSIIWSVYLSLILCLFLSVLGKRLGKSMGEVAKAVKAMSTEDILAFEKAGEVTFATHTLKLSDIKVHNLISIGQLLV